MNAVLSTALVRAQESWLKQTFLLLHESQMIDSGRLWTREQLSLTSSQQRCFVHHLFAQPLYTSILCQQSGSRSSRVRQESEAPLSAFAAVGIYRSPSPL